MIQGQLEIDDAINRKTSKGYYKSLDDENLEQKLFTKLTFKKSKLL